MLSVRKGLQTGVAVMMLTAAIGHTAEMTGQVVPDNAGAVASETRQLDINTASAAELKRLPGMGDAYVKRVIEGRPYTAKNQLVTRGILPQEAYERMRALIVAHRVAKLP